MVDSTFVENLDTLDTSLNLTLLDLYEWPAN